ncbi:hypothetical protein ACFLT5_03285 [Chloroflexota bacterium]
MIERSDAPGRLLISHCDTSAAGESRFTYHPFGWSVGLGYPAQP